MMLFNFWVTRITQILGNDVATSVWSIPCPICGALAPIIGGRCKNSVCRDTANIQDLYRRGNALLNANSIVAKALSPSLSPLP